MSQISYGSKFLRSDWSSCKHIYPWNLPCPNLQSKVNLKVSIGGFRSFHGRPWATGCRNKQYGFFSEIKLKSSILSLLFYTALFTNSRTLKFKSRLTIAFFAAVNHNYYHQQWTLKHRNTRNGSKSTNHRSQTLTFSTRLSKVLFPKRSVKMIDGSEKRKCQLVFELQTSRGLWKAQ